MTDKPYEAVRLVHLPKRRARKGLGEEMAQDLEMVIAGHFQEQNKLLREMNAGLQGSNRDLSEKVQRLTVGIERLVGEMHGVRTGTKDEAFARVGSSEAAPDLPTVAAEAAVIYTLTSGEIGADLGGFTASQIGLLLSPRGLGWAGNSAYQELARHKKPSQTKFWHHEVPARLRQILNDGAPEKWGIVNKAVLAIFRIWKAKREQEIVGICDVKEPTH